MESSAQARAPFSRSYAPSQLGIETRKQLQAFAATRERIARLTEEARHARNSRRKRSLIAQCATLQKESDCQLVELVKSSEGLVITLAKELCPSRAEMEECVSDGKVGLLEGLKRYNPARNTCLSTYLRWWIVKAMLSGLLLRDRRRGVYLPVGRHRDLLKVTKAYRMIMQREERTPTPQELMKETGLGARTIAVILKLPRPVRSLSESIDREDDPDVQLEGTLPQNTFPDQDVIARRKEQRVHLQKALLTLDRRERLVLAFRLLDPRTVASMDLKLDPRDVAKLSHLADRSPRGRPSLKEIGEFLGGITRERTRQIQVLAKQKLARAIQRRLRPPHPARRPSPSTHAASDAAHP